MNILVTGGAGFIGSNLVEELLREGHRITVLDNLHSGSQDNLRGMDAKFIKGNAGDVEGLDVGNPQAIFHEGVYSSSPMYKENPRLVAKVVDDFISLLEFAKKRNAQVIFASTSSLYSEISPPHREGILPHVTDFYTEARMAMERLAELYHRLYGMKIIGLRYFSVYGPRENSKGKYANLISQFLWAMQKGEAPIIYGDGTQTRDFIHVDDVVRANILAMKSGVKFGMYNVGTGKSCSLNELAALLNGKLGTSLKPVYVENRIKNYVQATLADTSKAKKELGFESKVSLEEGIARLISSGKH